jgi:CHAD domain-containing protein
MDPAPRTYPLTSLAAGRAVLRAIQERFRTAAEPRTKRRETFLDTFDGRVQRQGGSLAARREEGGWLLTWRTGEGAARGRQHTDELPAFAWDLPDGGLRGALVPVLDVRRLLRIATLEIEERAVRILDGAGKTVARAILERGRATGPEAGGAWKPLKPRLRLMSVRGYEVAFLRVARFLEEEHELQPDDTRESALALEALGVAPGGVSSRFRLRLDPQGRSDLAVKQILRKLLEAMQANASGTIRALDSEFLHDFRVAVRRTRSCLGQLKGILPPERVERFRGEFSWLGDLTGPARDLDVYVLQMSSHSGSVPEDLLRDLGPLREFLDGRLERERARVAEGLASERYRALVEDWGRFLEEEAPSELPEAARPILETAGERLERAFRRVLEAGRRVKGDTSDDALHRLRIRCKKLRYLLEFFRSLYEPAAVKELVRSLKGLQDNLGDFNDYHVQQEALGSFARQMAEAKRADVETLMAMGKLAGWMEEGQARERRRFDKLFACFAGMEGRFRRLLATPRSASGLEQP